jgi:hypothetical protein
LPALMAQRCAKEDFIALMIPAGKKSG